jgi:hypothetical protein
MVEINEDVSEDFPTPGEPVIPITLVFESLD